MPFMADFLVQVHTVLIILPPDNMLWVFLLPGNLQLESFQPESFPLESFPSGFLM